MHITVGGTDIPCRTMDAEWAELVRDAGIDPSTVYRLKCPTTARRHASIRVLLHPSDFAALLDTTGGSAAVADVHMGDLSFLSMNLLVPDHVLVVGGQGTVYAIELVDRRFFWDDAAEQDYNLTDAVDRTRYWPMTLDSDDEPFSGQEIIDALAGVVVESIGYDADATTVLSTTIGFGDVPSLALPIRDMIDHVLARCGCVLTWQPFTDSYTVRTLDGQLGVDQVAENSGNLKAGGVLAYPGTVLDDPNNAGVPALAVGPAARLRPIMSPNVVVAFPKTSSRMNHNADSTDPGLDFTDRWHLIESTAGKPDIGGGEGASPPTLHDAEWAIVDTNGTTITNIGLLTARADAVSAAYYSRFSSAVASALFMDLIPFVQWAGAAWIEWSIVQYGPSAGLWTRLRGSWDDEAFGWPMGGISSQVHGTGYARALPRPDGSVAIESLAPDLNLRVGQIIAVTPATGRYDVEDVQTGEVFTNLLPEDRALGYVPTLVNLRTVDTLVDLRYRNETGPYLWAHETYNTAPCAPGAAAAAAASAAAGRVDETKRRWLGR